MLIDRVQTLFENQYEDQYLPPSEQTPSEITEEPIEYDEWERELAMDTTTNELKTFIEGTPVLTNDPLQWWLDPLI